MKKKVRKARPLSKKITKKEKTKISKVLAKQDNDLTKPILGLLINIFIPGLGSIISGQKRIGTYQLLLFLIGIALTFFKIGYIIIPASWVWAIVTSIITLNKYE